MSQFVHLHVHTQFSLLDGMIKEKQLMTRCNELGMKSVAITDHGNMFGILKFYKAAKAAGVKPIIGCEVYVARGSRHDKSPNQGSPFHLVLLAENDLGYKNLIKIVSLAHLEGKYYRPRCDRELLDKYNEGIIALSACMQGEVSQGILKNELGNAKDALDYYRSTFKDRYYLEIQENKVEGQDKINLGILELAKEFSLPVVATNDCHYLEKGHADSQDILLCVGTGKTVEDENRMRFSTKELYVKSSDEMAALFPDHPEVLSNTLEVAERCNVEFEFGKFIYPHISLEEGQTPETAFEKMVWDGFEKRVPTIIRNMGDKVDPLKVREEYTERTKTEIALINEKGFASYFLIVQDFMNLARNRNIPVGPGRGSAAGSLVSYCLRITDIDPIRYGLLFERFLNPERLDNPDIDCDFCAEGRAQVIEYVAEKYGVENVAQIATFGTLAAKAVVRDVGRAMAKSYGDVDRIAKMIPDELGIKLADALKDHELVKAMQDEPWVQELFEHGKILEGINRHIGTHAAGVVIGNKPLIEYLPLTTGNEDEIITAWDKKDVEAIGLIKFDFLGLKTLTVIDKALKFIEQVHGNHPDMETIPMDDELSYKLLSEGRTTGVFQLESSGMKELLVRMQPSKIDDLIALVALYRPGPIGSGMIDTFIKCKLGRQKVTYELPQLEKYLAETYGMMVYQEQVMQVANAVAGFSLGDADLLRRAMSKKNPDAMAVHKEKFLIGAKDKNIPKNKAVKIWDLMEKFAAYGFNKSHSAAYGVLSYQTAYLKAHFPVEFMAALLTMDAGNSDKLMGKIAETREMGINVLPPDVNESVAMFSVHKGAIRYGLAGVKNVGVGAIEAIVEQRDECGNYIGLFDFCEKVDGRKVNRRVVESLIKAGAFDSINPDRARLLATLDIALERAARISRDKESGQMGLFGAACTSDGPVEDRLEEVPAWTSKEQLRLEKEVLGFYLTGHPLEDRLDLVKRFATTDSQQLKEMDTGSKKKVKVAGVVSGCKFRETKRGRMAICNFEDIKGSYELLIFSDVLETCKDAVAGDAPLLVIGNAERERDVKVIAEKVCLLREAEMVMSQEAHFNLNAEKLQQKQIKELKKLILNYPGRLRSVIHVEIPGKSVVTCNLSAKFSLDPSDELISEAVNLLGDNIISFR